MKFLSNSYPLSNQYIKLSLFLLPSALKNTQISSIKNKTTNPAFPEAYIPL